MKWHGIFGGVLLLTCLAVTNLSAGSLADDYRELVRKRQALESLRKEHEAQLEKLASQKKNLTTVFFQCISRRNQDYWKKIIKQAKAHNQDIEALRQKLDLTRKQIGKTGKALEERRKGIEASYTSKGPGTPYEAAFHEYMDALAQTYLQPLSEELFSGYQSLHKSLEENIDFLKDSTQQCTSPKDN